MQNKKYSIFGAGAAGLYTAWRLLNGEPGTGSNGESIDESKTSKQLVSGDILELYDWGQYNFSKREQGSRAAGGRVCTWHYQDDKHKSFLELGGMRYSYWDKTGGDNAGGHRLVTTVIEKLHLDQYSVPFNESTNPLYYLRSKNMYLNEITSSNPAPYNVNNYGATDSPDTGFNLVGNIAITEKYPKTRLDWCDFYKNGSINIDMPESSIYKKGDLLCNIAYWNLMFDQLGSEGFSYTSDGNGYTSNVINWNAAVALQANDEFSPGSEYRTLSTGYSHIFNRLFEEIVLLAGAKGIDFQYHPNKRLHSILVKEGIINYTIANREDPNKKVSSHTTDAAWMAMPRYAIDLVAQATRYSDHEGVDALDVLNHKKVQLYLESAILQPSYKIGMFFDCPWWLASSSSTPPYPAPITGYEVTKKVLQGLTAAGYSETYIAAWAKDTNILETPFVSADDFIKAAESSIQERLTYKQRQDLLVASVRNTIGPSVTDTPIRQVVYFGNNALDQKSKPIYGILASYDDEQFTSFWEELEYDIDKTQKEPFADNIQTLKGPKKATPSMVKMLRKQLAAVHFGPQADYSSVPEPLETKYMDWSLPPFNAGYHAYAAHYDVGDVQRMIRKPSQLLFEQDADIFIVGEAYSNDQAWVEGAFCTAESVLNDFFGIEPLISNKDYPFICPGSED